MEEYIKQLEQRITDLERRFFPIEHTLYGIDEFKSVIEKYKSEMIDRDGFEFCVEVTIETDLGTRKIQLNLKAYTEKQAFYMANQKVYEQMNRLRNEGKIEWFRMSEKKCV